MAIKIATITKLIMYILTPYFSWGNGITDFLFLANLNPSFFFYAPCRFKTFEHGHIANFYYRSFVILPSTF